MEKIMVTRSSMPEYEEYVEMIKPIWETHWLTNMGPYHNALEEKLKEKLGVENISLFTNGHLALELSIQALGLTGEVITTPFTFASTTHAIVRNRLKPIFCDINDTDYTIDVNKIESLITEHTSAIIPVHVYGNMCDVEAIQEIAKKHNLKVIYDAAHAFGVRYKGVSSANFGDISMFSFHATKVFNTIEGGAVAFRDSAVGRKLYQLKNFGIKNAEEVDGIGSNAKMNEFQAAMGLCNLRHFDDAIADRRRVVERYNALLENVEGIKTIQQQKNVESNYAYYPIVVDPKIFGVNRDQLSDILASHKVYSRKYFYPLTNQFDCYKELFDSDETPVAERISKQVLCLPLYEGLLNEDIDKICKIIISAHK